MKTFINRVPRNQTDKRTLVANEILQNIVFEQKFDLSRHKKAENQNTWTYLHFRLEYKDTLLYPLNFLTNLTSKLILKGELFYIKNC